MNHNNNFQQSSDGRHDDDAALTEFLSSLMGYTPTIPDELVEHYLAKSGFQCPDVRLIRLVAVATQKFVAEVATDALQYATNTFFLHLLLFVFTRYQGFSLFTNSSLTQYRKII
ncbi:hypothetical protein CICLE_v10009813mg [Citrus x clementina]|uniref:Transcription initiation factor TFIID subunit 10 n=1 Tax=Citrus clementina TaxID=85681 RepID=V4TSC3_CITCL|nr:hypothetical protein CICLE_v10009813mg [Citrus x clementina]